MRSAVVVFPASNCDRDMMVALEKITGRPPLKVWHGDASFPEVDLIALPGGFSFGDYLRAGAMAARSPVMREVIERAKKGVAVMGICNGFQVLTEAGLLPGALLPNVNLSFTCRQVELVVANAETALTHGYAQGDRISVPAKHGAGRYYAPAELLEQLEAAGQVVLRYAEGCNFNGSVGDIAGVMNEQGNVFGLMPHPEHATDALTGSIDGLKLLESLAGGVVAV